MDERLKVRSVSISSLFKRFDRELGFSAESSVGVTFDVVADIPPKELTEFVYLVKEQLDVQVLMMETARGSVSREDAGVLRKRIKHNYDQLLKRTQEKDDGADSGAGSSRED